MSRSDQIRLIECDLCHRRVGDVGFNYAPIYLNMLSKCLCPECSYWDMLANDRSRNIFVVNKVCYDVQPYQKVIPVGAMLGSHARVKYFLTESGKPFKSNDVWRIGRPPEHLLHLFPRIARFTTRQAYENLRQSYPRCGNSECLDRYHCYYYDWRDETSGVGVPLNHIVGSGQCPRFLNILQIEHFDYLT